MRNLNLIIAILIGLTFLSCSKDNSSNQDPLIGVWKPIKEVETYIDNSTIEFESSVCRQNSRFIINENGTLEFHEFANNEITGNCVERTEPVLTFGSWEKNSNGDYRIITTYTYTENQQSYTDDGIPDVLLFENNNNTLKIGYNDDEFINGNQLKNYYTEFVRID